MRFHDLDLELRVVKSAVSSPKKMSILRKAGGAKILHTVAQEFYERAETIARNQGQLPKWSELLTDPTINSATRESASEARLRPYKKVDIFKRHANRLGEYYRIRKAREGAREVHDMTSGERCDPEELADLYAKYANELRRITDDETFRHIGLSGKKPKRDGKAVLRDLKKRGAALFIPTGLRAFDDRSRGFMRNAFITISGQTGGGKTTLSDTIRTNQALNGFRTAYWSLEMDHEENETRLLARVTGLPMDKLLFPEKLKKSEQRRIITAYDEYVEKIVDNGGFTSVAAPRGSVSMSDILEESTPFGYDVIYIDYMTLMADADEEEQWKALGRAGRRAKVWAQEHNAVVVLLAQLSAEETIRYAKAVKEHANNMFAWPYGEREKQTHMVKVTQQKARNQPMYDFYLREEFEHMRFRDPTADELREFERTQTNVTSNRSNLSDYKRLNSGSKYISNFKRAA